MLARFVLSLISLFVLSQTCFADTCPSVADIKNNTLHQFKLYDIDDNKPVPPKRAAQFANHVDQFALAEWAEKSNQHGSIHCYYRDQNGSELEAYLAKDHLALQNTNDYWYQVSGYMHCAAGADKCFFKPDALFKNQLAKK